MFLMIAAVFFFHMLAAGMYGMAVKLYVAGFLLVSESTESPKFVTRFYYKYFRFWSNYMMSFFLTPALIIKPLFGGFEFLANNKEMRMIVIALMCLPLALVFSWLERRFFAWADDRKKRGIDDFNKKFGPKGRG